MVCCSSGATRGRGGPDSYTLGGDTKNENVQKNSTKKPILNLNNEEHIIVPLDRTMPIPFVDVYSALSTELKVLLKGVMFEQPRIVRGRAKCWQQLSEALTFIVSFRYTNLGRRLKNNWNHDRSDTNTGLQVLEDLRTLWDDAQYKPLEEKVLHRASEVNFDLTVPSESKWKNFDATILPLFYHNHKMYNADKKNDVPFFAQHILTCTRGARPKVSTGLFIVQKIDLIVLAVFNFVMGFICRLLGIDWEQEDERPQRASVSEADPADENGDPVEPVYAMCTEDRKCLLVRKTLEDQIRPIGLMKSLFKSFTVVEPHFDSVLVIYRDHPSIAPPKPPKKKDTDADEKPYYAPAMPRHTQIIGPGHRDFVGESLLEAGAAAGALASQVGSAFSKEGKKKKRSAKAIIQYDAHQDEGDWKIELTKNVAFGDLEMILPHKRLGLKVTDRVSFYVSLVTLFMCLFPAWDELQAARESEDDGMARLGVAAVVVVGLLGRLGAIISNYSVLQTFYMSEIQNWLSGRRVGQGVGIIPKLIDEVQDQVAKEALCVLFALLFVTPEEGLPLDELDRKIEDMLARRLGLHAFDFDCEAALEKLMEQDLAEKLGGEDEEPRYRVAKEPEDWLANHPAASFVRHYDKF